MAEQARSAGTGRNVLIGICLVGMAAVGCWVDRPGASAANRIFLWSFTVFAVGLAELFVLLIALTVLGQIDLPQALKDKVDGTRARATYFDHDVRGGAISLSRLQAFLWTLISMLMRPAGIGLLLASPMACVTFVDDLFGGTQPQDPMVDTSLVVQPAPPQSQPRLAEDGIIVDIQARGSTRIALGVDRGTFRTSDVSNQSSGCLPLSTDGLLRIVVFPAGAESLLYVALVDTGDVPPACATARERDASSGTGSSADVLDCLCSGKLLKTQVLVVSSGPPSGSADASSESAVVPLDASTPEGGDQ